MSMSDARSSLDPIDVALSPQERFDEFLQSRGMRNTPQRRTILKHVFSKHEHFDADQLIDRLPARGKTGYVSRPTVYRTLSEFVDAGLLRKLILDGRTVYEHDYGYPQHDHLYCTDCRRLLEFQSADLIELRNRVAAERDFRVKTHWLIITGVCEECHRKSRRVRKRVDMV